MILCVDKLSKRGTELLRFSKHANSEVQKPTDVCFFRCRQSS